MKNFPRILYVSRTQFGYMVPTYNNCRFLRAHFKINILTLNQNREKINLENLETTYPKQKNTRIGRYFSLILLAISLGKNNFDLILVEHFPFCFPISLFSGKTPMVLDIRTGGVSIHSLKRAWMNLVIKFDSLFFKNIAIISAGLRDRLGFPKKQTTIIPLGADKFERIHPRNLKEINLLYVGTLSGRNIEHTINGLASYIKSSPETRISYDIVGDGWHDERKNLQNLVDNLGLAETVHLHGYIHQKFLAPFFEKASIGISFVPITKYYDVQPATKTYEYLLAGIPVLATRTAENEKIINSQNGILIGDDPFSFKEGLDAILLLLTSYSQTTIIKSAENFTWQNIIDNTFAPFLSRVINEVPLCQQL